MILYSGIIFLIGLSDAIMSYTAPVFIEKSLDNSLLMGFVLSFSSLVGAVCDFVFSKYFHGKKFHFFLLWGIVGTILFPASFLLLPPIASMMLLSMLIWGIYFELIIFSNFHFVHSFMDKSEHASSWGILETFKACAYMTGPLIAANLITLEIKAPFYVSVFFTSIALFFALVFLKYQKAFKIGVEAPKKIDSFSFFTELKIWSLLLKKVWPLYLFVFMLNIVDSTFWSVGALLSEELKVAGGFGGVLLSAYTAPSLLMGFLAGRISKPFGKKKAAILSGVVAGFLFLVSGVIVSTLYFVITVFLASMFISMAWPQIMATFEDYIARLKEFGNDIVGLQSSSSSFSYIVGPVIATSTATIVGNRLTFSVMGALLLAASVVILLVLPKKIRMPQTELQEIETADFN